MKKLILLLILTMAIFATQAWRDFFPKTTEIYSCDIGREIVDVETDTASNLYVLSHSPGSLHVDVFSQQGKTIRTVKDTLILSEYTRPLSIEVSDDGRIILVRGWDRFVETPVNWVFDTTNEDILDKTGLLKYAEWLTISPSGNYFTMQGYIRRNSEIPFVYDLNSEEIDFEYQIEHAAFGKIDGREVLIATEKRPESRYLVIRDLETRETYMERQLTEGEYNVIVQDGKSALTKDALFILTRACKNPALFCYDRKTGELFWEDESRSDIAKIAPTLNGDAAVVQGFMCSRIYETDEIPVVNYCEDFENVDTRLLMSLHTEPTVWSDIQILATSYTVYLKRFLFFSVVMPYSDPDILAPVQFEGIMDGFLLDGESYVIYALDSTVTVYRIID